jgi:hypothetical protein
MGELQDLTSDDLARQHFAAQEALGETEDIYEDRDFLVASQEEQHCHLDRRPQAREIDVSHIIRQRGEVSLEGWQDGDCVFTGDENVV